MRYLTFILCLNFTIAALAQNTGKTEYQGLEFTIPSGWYGNISEDGYLVQKNGSTHYMIIQPQPLQNLYQIQQELNSEIPIDDAGTAFTRNSEIESISQNGLGARFSVATYEQEFYMYVAGVTNNAGRGALIVAGDQNGVYNQSYEQACKQILTTMNFKTIEARKGGLNSWEKRYGDSRLTYFDSYYSGGYGDVYGAYRQKIIIDLCSKGYFNYNNDFEMGGGGDASAFIGTDGSAGEGNWYIKTSGGSNILVLEFFDGQKYEYNLEVDNDGATYLNGDRYYKSTRYDEAEYHPDCF